MRLRLQPVRFDADQVGDLALVEPLSPAEQALQKSHGVKHNRARDMRRRIHHQSAFAGPLPQSVCC
ncbi:MAG TPA: hypothetical protein VKM72_26655 [Thermoanaerobaculia bacterium]|nr:hypothetical protein [Thermoanaerobaculia bacterium]